MIAIDTSAIDAVNTGRDTPDAFYNKSTLIATSKWHKSDAWRGYNVITPEPGYKLVDDDFATGEWGDAVSAEHGPDATQKRLEALEREHGDLFVIYTPTSNVFSTGIDVLARDPDTAPKRTDRGKLIAKATRQFSEPNGSWRVRYHATDVIAYDAKSGKYTLNTGGWNTMTTARRITDHLPAGCYAYRRNWVMYLHLPGCEDVEIIDGLEVTV